MLSCNYTTPYEPRRAVWSTGLPRHNLERYGRPSFSCAGPVLWNSLPEDMRLAGSLNSFKSHLKTHYFKPAYNLRLYTIRTLHNIILILKPAYSLHICHHFASQNVGLVLLRSLFFSFLHEARILVTLEWIRYASRS